VSSLPREPAELACVAATLRMAARTITRRYDDALRPSGLRTTQLSMLSRLREDGPLPVTALANRLALERTTVTRELDTLARRGLVSLATGDDRRTRLAAITADGRAAMRVAVPLWREAQTATDELLGPERVERLLADLRVAVRS
jgi:DNA-binding MarR family transcriptional regulator